MEISLKVRRLVFSAVVGAVYTAITLLLAPISFGPIQLRVSEALCVLPFLYPGTVWGLFVGCLLSNIIGGLGLLDIVFGSLATLAAAFLTSKIRNKYLAALPPVLINAVVIGAVIAATSTPGAFWASFPVFALQVGIGQLGACYIIGLPLLHFLPKIPALDSFGRRRQDGAMRRHTDC